MSIYDVESIPDSKCPRCQELAKLVSVGPAQSGLTWAWWSCDCGAGQVFEKTTIQAAKDKLNETKPG